MGLHNIKKNRDGYWKRRADGRIILEIGGL